MTHYAEHSYCQFLQTATFLMSVIALFYTVLALLFGIGWLPEQVD